MGAAFIAKCRAGTAQAHGSGYGGSGFKFDSTEDDSQRAQRQVLRCLAPRPARSAGCNVPLTPATAVRRVCVLTRGALQAAAKQAAKEAGAAEEEEDDDDGAIIQVDEDMMRQREAAAALNAALHAPPTQVRCPALAGCTPHVRAPRCSMPAPCCQAEGCCVWGPTQRAWAKWPAGVHPSSFQAPEPAARACRGSWRCRQTSRPSSRQRSRWRPSWACSTCRSPLHTHSPARRTLHASSLQPRPSPATSGWRCALRSAAHSLGSTLACLGRTAATARQQRRLYVPAELPRPGMKTA